MNSKGSNLLSVSQLSQILKACFENPAFQDIEVYGEVYSLRLGKFSYIELGDQGKNQISSPLLKVAFSTFYGQDFQLDQVKVGDVIKVRGSLSYYPHGSSVTLWGNELTLLESQMGKTLLQKRKTLEKLEKLGYLDEKRKKKVPAYCRKIAILTAEGGAAYQDILKTLHDRFPVSTVLFPVVVQGEKAASSIYKALEEAKKGPFDAILLGRGGGSKTDLSCFDDEKVSLSIATSPIPVITAIGHTIDTAIADRVSDVKAITPTEGASLINPSLSEIDDRQKEFLSSLRELFIQKLREKDENLNSFVEQILALSPKKNLLNKEEKKKNYLSHLNSLFLTKISLADNGLENYGEKLEDSIHLLLERKTEKLSSYKQTLLAYDPKKISEKGLCEIFKDGKKTFSVRELKPEDRVELVYIDGRRDATIDK
ncbi:MAG: exodeoxyribonuclease VII large subunit [Bacilli bacterium]